MRCQACNCELTDYESVRKDQHGEYVDLCSTCYRHTTNDLDIFVVSKNDFNIADNLEDY